MFYGNTYGPLGGTVALAETQGQFAGYEKQGDLIEKDKQRKREQEKWDILKPQLERKAQLDKDKFDEYQIMKSEAEAERMGGTPSIARLAEVQKQQNQQIEHMNKLESANLFTRYLSTDDPYTEVKQLRAKLKESPQMAMKLGIKNSDTLELPSSSNRADVDAMTAYLSKIDPDFGNMFKPVQDKMVQSMLDSNQFIKADGKIIDVYGMAMGMGILNTMPADIKDKAEKVRLNASEFWKQGGTETSSAKGLADQAEVDIINDMGGNAQLPEGTYTDTGKGISEPFIDTTVPQGVGDSVSTRGTAGADRRKKKEGFRSEAYQDTEGNWTIGYGHKIKPEEEHLKTAKLSEEAASKLLESDMKEHSDKFYEKEPWAANLPAQTKEALEDMAFNMGPAWMDKFPSVREKLQQGDVQGAANIIRNSKYAQQVGDRADENASLIDGRPTVAQTDDWMAQTYRGGGAVADYRKALGFPDTRTTDLRTLDGIAQRLGPNATNEQVLTAFQALKRSKSGGSSTYTQRLENAKQRYLNGDFGPVGSEEALEGYKNQIQRIENTYDYGKQTNVKQSDLDLVQGYSKFRNSPNIVSRPQAEEMSRRFKGTYLADSKQYKENIKAVDDMIVPFKELAGINKEIANMSDDEIMRGVISGPIKKAAEYIPAVGEVFTKSDANEFRKNLRLDTKAGMFLASYIKSISGLAVTDAERRILTEIAGLSDIKDASTMRTRLAAMQEAIGANVKHRTKIIGDLGDIGSEIIYNRDIDEGMKGISFSTETGTSTGTGTSTQQSVARPAGKRYSSKSELRDNGIPGKDFVQAGGKYYVYDEDGDFVSYDTYMKATSQGKGGESW